MIKKLLEPSDRWANFWLDFDGLMWLLGITRLIAFLFPDIVANSEGGFALMCLIAVGYLRFRTVHGEG